MGFCFASSASSLSVRKLQPQALTKEAFAFQRIGGDTMKKSFTTDGITPLPSVELRKLPHIPGFIRRCANDAIAGPDRDNERHYQYKARMFSLIAKADSIDMLGSSSSQILGAILKNRLILYGKPK